MERAQTPRGEAVRCLLHSVERVRRVATIPARQPASSPFLPSVRLSVPRPRLHHGGPRMIAALLVTAGTLTAAYAATAALVRAITTDDGT